MPWSSAGSAFPGAAKGWLLAAAGLALVLALAFLIDPAIGVQADICWFHRSTGLPCPACGLSRGCEWLVRGEWGRAWQLNPLSYLAFPALVLGFFLCLARGLGWQPGPLWNSRLVRLGWALAGLLVVFWLLRLAEAILGLVQNSG